MSKRYGILASSIAVFLLCLFCNYPAFSMNEAYLSPEKWQGNSNVIYKNISSKSNGNSMDGLVGYYYDSLNGSLFTRIFVNESSLDDENDDVRINYSFFRNNEIYSFSVDDNGICESLGDIGDLFSVKQNFNRSGQNGDYIVGIDIDEGLGYSDVKIMLYVNGSKYLICNTTPLQEFDSVTPSTSTTQAQQGTEKSQHTNYSTKIDSASANTNADTADTKREISTYPTTAKQRTTVISNNGTTKIVVQPIEQGDVVEQTTIIYDDTTENQQHEQQDSKTLVRTKGARAMLIAGAFVLTLGTVLMIFGIMYGRPNVKNDKNENT